MPNFTTDDPTWSDAIREAWAVAPAGLIPYDTLEFLFTRDGVLRSERFVRERHAITATLEADAPLDASAAALFNPAAFSVKLPEQKGEGGSPQMDITVPNIGRELALHLKAASFSATPVRAVYRVYTNLDLTAPHQSPGPLIMDVASVSANVDSVTAHCHFGGSGQRRFPGLEYQLRHHPSMATR
jgi:hypothetical protein